MRQKPRDGLMMNNVTANGQATTTARVLVVVDIHSQLIASLEVAVAMASARRAGLHGMCIDDPELQQTAGLPFSQEVMLLGGRTRRLEDQQLRRSMGRFQARFRSLLAERAQSHSIPWSVSTVSGQRQVLERSDRAASDIVIMGKPGQARAAGRAPARILVLAHDYASVLPTLEVLLKLNTNRRNEVLLLTHSSQEADEASRLAEQLGNTQHTVVRAVSLLEASRLCAASSSPLEYVLAASDANPETLGQVIRWASCPVILTS